MTLHVDKVLADQLKTRGIDSTTGVYGDHKLQIGNGQPIALDTIESNPVPSAGFKRATQIQRGREGLETMAGDTLKALTRTAGEKLDAKALLGALKAGKTQIERMNALGQLTEDHLENTMWVFTKSIEKLSNEDLARIYQAFNSKEMDLLQSALRRESQVNSKADDAAFAADALFDLEALVIKEVSNRAMLCQIDEAIENTQDEDEINGLEQMKPETLTESYGAFGYMPSGRQIQQPAGKDITALSLMGLVEVTSGAATQRANNAQAEAQRLARRGVKGVSVTEMGNVLRNAELTINMPVDVLFKETSLLKKPNQPLLNIFHLKKMGISTKTDEYIRLRDTAEKIVFPELENHKLDADERPVYGALNIGQHGKGAVANGEFGNVCIVLKDHVKQRATYAAGDTFYAPKIKITPERKANFYRLLDGCGINPEAAAILRDPNSAQHKKLERVLQGLAANKYADATAFKTGAKATGLVLPDAEDDNLRTLLFQCFVDSEATNASLTTYDNLETLVTGLDEVDGNMLANAAQKSRRGEQNPASLGSGRYIEAQIHGLINPSRDIAEIRIDISELESMFGTPEELENARAELQAFTRQTGVPVIITDLGDKDDDRIMIAAHENEEFSQTHIDAVRARQDLEKMLGDIEGYMARHELQTTPPVENMTLTDEDRELIRQKALAELQRECEHPTGGGSTRAITGNAMAHAVDTVFMAKAERITDAAKALRDTMADNVSQTFADYCRQHPEVTHGYAIPLDDDAAAELAKQFRLNVAEDLKTTKNPENDIPGLVRNAFDRAAANLVGQKVAMLQQLDAMGLDEPVKELAASFIVSEQGLTAAQFQTIWAAATAQRDLLQGMLAANPPKTAGEIAAALRGFMQALNVPEAAAPLTAKAAMEKATGLAMALLGLSAPPAGLDGVRALRDQLDSAQMRGKLAMLKQAVRAADTPEQAAPVNLFIDTAETVCRALCDKAREMDVAQQQAQIALLPENEREQAGLNIATNDKAYSAPSPFIGTLAMIPAPARAEIAALSPGLAEALETKAPAHPAFPVADNPQALPQNDRQRRDFLVNHVDLYLRHEKTFERGKSTHGRGHITRAFIFANVMSNILIEKGVPVDKNAVMLGIAGHDSGRQGQNNDRWEKQSADITVNLMKQDYGENTMGAAYAKEVGDCIDAHKSKTVEGMLLNSADSLDIGRTKDFDPQYFAFLKDSGVEEAEQIRQELIKEANLLQRLTDPYCAHQKLVQKYGEDILDESLPQAVQEELSTQLTQLAQNIADQFIADWDTPAEEFVTRYENTIKNNPQLFPLMNKYYTANEA